MHNRALDTACLTCKYTRLTAKTLLSLEKSCNVRSTMVSTILGVLGSIWGAVDLSRLDRDGTAVVWFLGGIVLSLLVPFGGLAMRS